MNGKCGNLKGVHTEEDNDQLNGYPDAVEDVVFPAEVLETDGVDILVEDQCDLDTQVHQHETLSTDVVRQNLDGVGNQKTGPGKVVGSVVDEDHSNDGTAGSGRLVKCVLRRADCPNDEGDQHTRGGGQEKRATTELVDREGEADGNAPIPD